MNASFLALRAITGVTFRRILLLASTFTGLAFSILWILLILLASTVSTWWWIGAIILVPLTITVAVIGMVLFILANRLIPRKMTREERTKVHKFTSTLLGLAEVRATPWPLLAFLIGKDIIRGRSSSYIESTINDAKGLRTQFDAIRQLFR